MKIGMKIDRFLKIGYAFLLISGALSADEVEDRYRNLVGKSLFTSNTSNLGSGFYKFNRNIGDAPELTNSSFVFPYFFGEDGDSWRPFIEGGVGFSKIEQDDVKFNRGSFVDSGDIELKSFYYKIGGGLSYNPTSDFSFVVGGSALFMNTDADYKSRTPLTSSTTDIKIDKIFNSDNSNNSIYDGYGGFVYKPTIYGYKSELKSSLHYIKMKFDHSIDDEEGIYLNLLAKIHTNQLATIMEQPLWLEYYAGGDFVNSELADIVGFNSAVTVGTTLHWKIGPLIPILRDTSLKDLNLAFNVQKTFSNTDFEGWKAGVGFSLMKF